MVFALCSAKAEASELKRHFVTDYCTGYKEGTRDDPTLWQDCCVAHDLYLWAGGTRAQRNQVDLELRECIEARGAKTQAYVMWVAVRAGSLSPIKIGGKQWGNAWGDKTRHSSLSLNEIEILKRDLTLNSELAEDEIEAFVYDLILRNQLSE